MRFLHIAVKNYILCLKAGVSGPTEKADFSHFVTLVYFHSYGHLDVFPWLWLPIFEDNADFCSIVFNCVKF